MDIPWPEFQAGIELALPPRWLPGPLPPSCRPAYLEQTTEKKQKAKKKKSGYCRCIMQDFFLFLFFYSLWIILCKRKHLFQSVNSINLLSTLFKRLNYSVTHDKQLWGDCSFESIPSVTRLWFAHICNSAPTSMAENGKTLYLWWLFFFPFSKNTQNL